MCPWIWRFKKGWLQNGQSSWFSPKCFSFTWRLQLDCIEKAVLQIAQMNPLSKPSFLITKSLIPEIIRGDVGYFYFLENAQICGGSCNSLSTLHESTTPMESLVSGNTQVFLLHMPCTAPHVPNHFVAHCAQVTSVSSQNKILNAWNRHRYQDDPSLSETVLPTGTDMPK